MDPIKLEKFEAMHNYNNAFFVYILTALTLSLVFFSPLWYPSSESLIISLPNLISLLLTPKCLFIVGNLIVFVLVGESKLLTPKPSQKAPGEVYYDEYLSRSLKQKRPVTSDNVVTHRECKKPSEVTRSGGRTRPIRKLDSVKVNKEVWSSEGSVVRTLSAEELSKRADDFIARVNRQRRLEATDLAHQACSSNKKDVKYLSHKDLVKWEL